MTKHCLEDVKPSPKVNKVHFQGQCSTTTLRCNLYHFIYIMSIIILLGRWERKNWNWNPLFWLHTLRSTDVACLSNQTFCFESQFFDSWHRNTLTWWLILTLICSTLMFKFFLMLFRQFPIGIYSFKTLYECLICTFFLYSEKHLYCCLKKILISCVLDV